MKDKQCQEEIMGDREYKAKGTISKVDYLRKISPPHAFATISIIIGS